MNVNAGHVKALLWTVMLLFPARTAKLFKAVSDLRERCESELGQKNMDLDFMDVEFGREMPEMHATGAYYLTIAALTAEEVERTRRVPVHLDEALDVLRKIG